MVDLTSFVKKFNNTRLDAIIVAVEVQMDAHPKNDKKSKRKDATKSAGAKAKTTGRNGNNEKLDIKKKWEKRR